MQPRPAKRHRELGKHGNLQTFLALRPSGVGPSSLALPRKPGNLPTTPSLTTSGVHGVLRAPSSATRPAPQHQCAVSFGRLRASESVGCEARHGPREQRVAGNVRLTSPARVLPALEFGQDQPRAHYTLAPRVRLPGTTLGSPRSPRASRRQRGHAEGTHPWRSGSSSCRDSRRHRSPRASWWTARGSNPAARVIRPSVRNQRGGP